MKALHVLACAFLAGATANAAAETFPSRPVTVVVGFVAGGPSDTIARLLVEPMRRVLDQPVIIENVSGAAGAVGIQRVLHAGPDGYTLSLGNWSSHVGAPGVNPGPFDVRTDLVPVSRLPIAPLLIVGKKGLPPNTVKELIDYMKANPDKISAGIVGFGSASHVTGIYFQKETGTRFQFVPYRGGAPATQDLLSGQIDLRLGTEASQVLAYLRSGQMKPYAVLAHNRWRPAPDIPTIEEAGVPSLTISLWHGLWAPKGTPRDVIDKLSRAAAEAMNDPTVQKRLEALGMEIPREHTPQALAAFHKAEIEKWWPVIKSANIKPQ